MTIKGVTETGRRGWLTTFAVVMALGAISLGAPSAANATGKDSVVLSVEVKASPGDVWKLIGGFDRLQDWHPAVESSTVNGSPTAIGTERTLHLKGGGEIHEQLTSYSDSAMRYTYQILSSPLPVANYESHLGVVDEGGGKSLVIWGSTFDPAGGATDKKAKAVIAGVYKAGLDNIVKKFGPAPMMKPHKMHHHMKAHKKEMKKEMKESK
jgi:Polyketide cyclase / dehydrase and lipid transport